MKRKSIFVAFLALLASTGRIAAHDFVVDGIYYKITSSTAPLTVAVTFQGGSYSAVANEYSGEITIPETVSYNEETYSVTSIVNQAFRGCTSLTSVVIPQSITSVGDRVFYGCTQLTELIISDGDASLAISPIEVVMNCPIEQIYLGRNLEYSTKIYGTTYYYSPFENLATLKHVTCGDRCTTIPSMLFSGTGLVDINLNHVETIGGSAFRGCSFLSSLTLPNSLKTIEAEAFYYCEGLKDVQFGTGLETIGLRAFALCTSLTSIYLRGNNLEVGEKVFYRCFGLKNVALDNSVSYIQDSFYDARNIEAIDLGNADCLVTGGISAFSYNYNVASVTVHATTPPNLGEYGVYKFGTFSSTLYVPKGTRDLYAAADVWKEFTNIVELDDYTLTVTKAGLATLYLSYPVSIPDEILNVSYVSSVDYDEGILTLTKVEHTIPAYTGVIIYANMGSYTLPFADSPAAPVTDNVLRGVLSDTSIATLKSEGGFDYILTLGQGNKGGFIGFYNYIGTTLGANKCYIGLTSDAGVKSLKLSLDRDVETGMKIPNSTAQEGEYIVYDLQGRRISRPTKGIYVINGKKVLYR